MSPSPKALISEERLNDIRRQVDDSDVFFRAPYPKDIVRDLLSHIAFLTAPVDGAEVEGVLAALEHNARHHAKGDGVQWDHPDYLENAASSIIRRLQSTINQQRAETETARRWRCFFCDDTFTTPEAASEHFGSDEGCYSPGPACKLNEQEGGILKLYTEALAELRKYQIEDHEMARQFYALGAEHSAALMREEEKGYARGLADGRALIPTQKERT